MKSILLPALGLAAALTLAGCNQTTAPAASASVSADATPSSLRLPEGAGCKGEIERYRAIMTNDLAMGHVNQSVYNKVDRELGTAETACAAGRDAEAVRMVDATKRRHGYR